MFLMTTLLQTFLDRQGPCTICLQSDCLESWHCEESVWSPSDGRYCSVVPYNKQELVDSPNKCPFCRVSIPPHDRQAHSCQSIPQSLILIPHNPAAIYPFDFTPGSSNQSNPSKKRHFSLLQSLPPDSPQPVIPPAPAAPSIHFAWKTVSKLCYENPSAVRRAAHKKPYCYRRSVVYIPPVAMDDDDSDDDGLMIL